MIQSTFALPHSCKHFLEEFAEAPKKCQKSIEEFKEASDQIVGRVVIFDFYYVKKLAKKMLHELSEVEDHCGIDFKKHHQNSQYPSLNKPDGSSKNNFIRNAESEAKGFFKTYFGV